MGSRELYEAILLRRSVRNFDGRPVTVAMLDELVEAARWAPSGMNNQPWRFATVESREMMEKLSAFSKYAKLIRSAPAAVAVFLDNESVYNRTKDVQGIGAATENILLAAHALGLGACWIGEILNRREEVEKALGTGPNLELMALVIVGYPDPEAREGARRRTARDKLIVGRY